MTGVKWLVLLIFFAIVLSLGSAMVQLVHDHKGESRRMVRALTVRIGLSILLFIVLWWTWKMGWIEPHARRRLTRALSPRSPRARGSTAGCASGRRRPSRTRTRTGPAPAGR